MTDENLARMNDGMLLKLFSHTTQPPITKRARQVMTELEQRGYIYDEARNLFFTCEQWNATHPTAKKNCASLRAQLRPDNGQWRA